MRTEIKTLHQETGTTTLYVTHDQVEALSLGTAIVVMNEGHLEQYGTPSEIYYEPATQFVAQFVGSPSMNFMEVSVQREGESLVLKEEGVHLPLESEQASRLGQVAANGQITLGVRPEHFVVAPPDGPTGIHGAIKIIEPLGKDQYLHVLVGATEFTVRTDPEETFKVGDQVRLDPVSRHLYFFDPNTGARIG